MRRRQSVSPGVRLTGWYAVLALAVVAALGATTVVGAGLSLWRGSAAQRAVRIEPQPLLRPGSGVVTVPARPAHASHPRPHAVAAAPPAVVAPPAPTVSARGSQVHRHVSPAAPATPAHASAPSNVTPTKPHPTVALPTIRVAAPAVFVPVARADIFVWGALPIRAHVVRGGYWGHIGALASSTRPSRVAQYLSMTRAPDVATPQAPDVAIAAPVAAPAADIDQNHDAEDD